MKYNQKQQFACHLPQLKIKDQKQLMLKQPPSRTKDRRSTNTTVHSYSTCTGKA